jgi:hypothetical protein
MGSLRPRNSTRARKVRSAKSLPRPRRKPGHKKHAPPRTPPEVLRTAKRNLRGSSGQKLRASPTVATALHEIHERLEAALSVTSLCGIVLKAQAADHDIDIALCLECCVEKVISNEMEHIDSVLKGGAS